MKSTLSGRALCPGVSVRREAFGSAPKPSSGAMAKERGRENHLQKASVMLTCSSNCMAVHLVFLSLCFSVLSFLACWLGYHQAMLSF